MNYIRWTNKILYKYINMYQSVYKSIYQSISIPRYPLSVSGFVNSATIDILDRIILC